MRRSTSSLAALVALGSLVVGAVPAGATIESVTGPITKIAAPASIQIGALSSTTTMYAFDEQQGVTLQQALRVDLSRQGTYESPITTSVADLPAGTVVDSHYVSSDRPSGTTGTLTGTLTFSSDILGIVTTAGKLVNSDYLGAPGTSYPGGVTSRGLEFGIANDGIVWTSTRTITFRAQTSSQFDQIRVLTAHTDFTPPVVTGTASPAANANGWNRSPVTVSFSATDAESPVTALSAQCATATIASDTTTDGTTRSCTATSAGGAASASVTVRLDQVAPTLTGTPTTPPNANGWYKSPVTIAWSCSDALSGIAGTCPANATLSTEGTAVSTTASVTDRADNTTNASSAAVKIDTHAPTTAISALPAWNNTDVALTLSASDNLSGVDQTWYALDNGAATSGTSVAISAEGVHTVTYWSVDNAGNIESSHTTAVRIDKTPPTISALPSPLPNARGWNNSTVTVTFVCADALSGVAACSGPATVATDGADQQVSGTSTDNAGNTATAHATVNLDTVAPTVSASRPAPNANGWYDAPVTVTWSCADTVGGSGITSCSPSQTLSTDGVTDSVSGSATDAAGNTTSATDGPIRIDTTAPSISAEIVAPAVAGWNNTPVTVHFSCADTTSGLTAGACPADVTVTDDGVTSVTGSVTDRAGNSASASVTVEIDLGAPAITATRTPAPNAAGWNNTPVTVSFTCSDSRSGLAPAGCSPSVELGEGAAQSASGTATDIAGNASTTSVDDVNVDVTAPTLSGAPTTDPTSAGWYRGPVTITWTCSDPAVGTPPSASGIASCPADSTIDGEGAALSASASASDVAGNATTATSTSVAIDTTAPTTDVSDIVGWTNNSATLTFVATDALSGVASTQFTIDGGPVHTGTTAILTTDGIHDVAVWSTDVAGNVEATHHATVKVDSTAPVVTADQQPTPNAAGWNAGPVTVTFTCSDATSGVASCTQPVHLVTDGAAQLATGTAVDNAGNRASITATVNIDTTAPTISGSAPAANANGWHNGPVTVSWTCDDTLSGVAACSDATTVATEGAGQSATGTAADAAGNSASSTFSGISIDATAPTITAVVPSTASGWYRDDVTVHWTCADTLSGVASCPADDIVTLDGTTTVVGVVTDAAGNTASAEITIRIDRGAPLITGAASPAPNANGWNRTAVTVSFSCTDEVSGVATCAAPSVLGDGTNQSVTGAASDVAGNAATTTVGGVNVDTVAPTLSGAATSAVNAQGWYNHAVTVHWTCADDRSGVDPTTCPADAGIASEGSGQRLNATLFDLAGNSTTAASTPVNIDLTAPSTVASSVPANFTSADVTVTLSASDNLSGVADTAFSIDGGAWQHGTVAAFTTEGVHTLRWYSTDTAGNVETQHAVTVRIDKTAPSITASRTPAPNSAGWNNGSVSVSFTCGDSLSGIASCTGTQTITTEGSGQLVVGNAADNAGNTATTSLRVSIDRTPPTITSAYSTAPNSAGWFRSTVGVSFTCGDALSGIASCTAPSTVGEGRNQTRSGTAVDNAGNSASTTTSAINVDLTAPTITVAADRAPGTTGTYTAAVTLHFTCADALSGIATTNGCPADRVVNTNGTTTVTGTATDAAGNTATTSITVTLSLVRQHRGHEVDDVDHHRSEHKDDDEDIRDGRRCLANSADPVHWLNDAQLRTGHESSVFSADKCAAEKFANALKNKKATAADKAEITGWLRDMLGDEHDLALGSINAAVAARVNAAWITSARTSLARADAEAAAGSWSAAAADYATAYFAARGSRYDD